MDKNKKFMNSPIKIALLVITIIAVLTVSSFLIADSVLTKKANEKIGMDRCIDIVLSNAGLDEVQVTDLSATYTNEGSSPIYKIEFNSEDYKFSYNVNVHTGEILSFTKDKLEREVKEENQNEVPNSTEGVNSNNSSLIELETAKSIALSDADLNNNQVVFTKSKLDKDDEIYVYEIEFDYNNLSYEYEVNAHSGKIIDKEIDD